MDPKTSESQENVFTHFGRLWSGVDSRRVMGGCAAIFGVALLFFAWHSSGDTEEFEEKEEDSPVIRPVKKIKKSRKMSAVSLSAIAPNQAMKPSSEKIRAAIVRPIPPLERPINISSIRANLDYVDAGPCHIYSQVIDDQTHNIIFFSVPDWRSHVPVEPVNITHSSSTVEDFLDLGGVNRYGQKLAYRIIVKNKKVVGVLMQDRGVKKLDFVEHMVPEEGDLVEVTFDGSIGIVKCVPISLIVTNRDNEDEITEKEIEYSRGRRPKGRYFEELHGYIDLEVVRIHGNWKKTPVLEANHVTYLKPADSDVVDEYYTWKCAGIREEHDQFDNEYLKIIGDLQNLFDRAGEEPPSEDTFIKIQDSWKRLEDITSKVSDNCLQETKERVSKIKTSIMRAQRRIKYK